jgi:hypothetical protein
MIEDSPTAVLYCCCLKCLHEWISPTDQPPRFCRNPTCRSLDWNEKKPRTQRSHVNEIKLPSPRSSGRPRTTSFDYDED